MVHVGPASGLAVACAVVLHLVFVPESLLERALPLHGSFGARPQIQCPVCAKVPELAPAAQTCASQPVDCWGFSTEGRFAAAFAREADESLRPLWAEIIQLRYAIAALGGSLLFAVTSLLGVLCCRGGRGPAPAPPSPVKGSWWAALKGPGKGKGKLVGADLTPLASELYVQ